ncbi:MAG: hypothetical protein QUS66_05105 [Bacteroidota bacterium]|nr:hypothetical protein [Bacteroidota bacterium]
MDFLKAVDIIGRDLEEAMTLLEQLGVSGPEKAEIELARSRVRSAADLVRLLPSLTAANDNKAHDAPRRAEASHKTGININPPEETRVPMAEPAKTEPVIAESVKTAPMSDEPKTQEPSKGILADRFTSGSTLAEKMQTEKKEEVASSVIKGKPVSDIAAAIGINDRFYFIRELFSGDALAYGDTIKRLNAAASLGEAMKILDESTVMGSDPAAQSSFVDVVRRKFSLNV